MRPSQRKRYPFVVFVTERVRKLRSVFAGMGSQRREWGGSSGAQSVEWGRGSNYFKAGGMGWKQGYFERGDGVCVCVVGGGGGGAL